MIASLGTEHCNEGEILDQVQAKDEHMFESGTFYCSEAVLHTINDLLGQPFTPEIIKMASGFPVGMGKAQCLCGAVSGGQMALGIVYGRVKGEAMSERMFEVAKGLHDYILEEYKSTCCRVITRQWEGDNFVSEGRKRHCIAFTGKVARWVAKVLLEDEKIPLN